MESRRKKQYLVAGMMVFFSGMACVLPMPTREPGTPTSEAAPLAVGAEQVISPMPSDPTRLNAVLCENEECE